MRLVKSYISNSFFQEFYVEEILDKTFLPFKDHTYPEGHRFLQDNDPKHTSRLAKDFMKNNDINHWPTPAESPDLNPIEMVWAELKRYNSKTVKASNKMELINGILKFWRNLDIGKCNTYINHLRKVLPAVVEREGRATGY